MSSPTPPTADDVELTDEDKAEILKEVWYDPLRGGGSSGVLKTWQFVREAYPSISRRFVENWLKSQESYQIQSKRDRSIFRPTIEPEAGWCNVDLAFMSQSDFPKSANGGHIGFVCVRWYLSKWLQVQPIKAKSSAEVARALKKMWVGSGRVPSRVRSDRGTEFGESPDGYGVPDLVRDYKIEWRFTRAYNSRANGLVERSNRQVKAALFRMTNAAGTKRWVDVLPDVVFSINWQVHSVTKQPPGVLWFGGTIDLRKQLLKKGGGTMKVVEEAEEEDAVAI